MLNHFPESEASEIPAPVSPRVIGCFFYGGHAGALVNCIRQLDDTVDVFVIVESNKFGPVRFNPLICGVARWAAKIRHVVIPDDLGEGEARCTRLESAAMQVLSATERDCLLICDENLSPLAIRQALGQATLADGGGERRGKPQLIAVRQDAQSADSLPSTLGLADLSPQMPVVICPYLYDHEIGEVSRRFGLGEPETAHIPFFFWKDEGRLGPERAFEQCWSQFPDDDIIIVHTDMHPMPGEKPNEWYDALCRYRERLPWAGMLACNLLYPRTAAYRRQVVQCAGGRVAPGMLSHLHGPVADPERGGEVTQYLLSQVRPVDWVTFGGVLIRRDLLNACGDFDGGYRWAYYMDVDYCLEARQRGFPLVQVPVFLEHEESRTTTAERQADATLARHLEHNRLRLHAKWNSLLPFVAPDQAIREASYVQPALSALNDSPPALAFLQTEPFPAGLIVLGMHRSGTSCLAGMLEGAGFHAGEVFNWNEDNRRGNKEDGRVIRLNDAVLEQSGGTWSRPVECGRWNAGLERDRDALLEQLLLAPGPWLLKDPRTLLALSFWRDAISRPRRIGVFRSPSAVAQSLATRNGFRLKDGLELWAAYNERLLQEYQRSPFPVVCFDVAPADFIRAVSDALERICPDLIADRRISVGDIGQFYAGELVHQQAAGLPSDDLLRVRGVDAGLLARLKDLYARLCVAAGEPHVADAPVRSDAILQYLVRVEDALDAGRHADAYAACEAAIASHPRRSDLWMRLVTIAKESSDFELLCRAVTDGLVRLPKDSYLLLEQARIAWSRGSLSDAMLHAQQASAEAADWIEPRLLLAVWATLSQQWQIVVDALQRPLEAGKVTNWAKVLQGAALICLGDKGKGDASVAGGMSALGLAEKRGAYALVHWSMELNGASDAVERRPQSRSHAILEDLTSLMTHRVAQPVRLDRLITAMYEDLVEKAAQVAIA